MTHTNATAASPVLAMEGAVARITLARPDQHNAIRMVDLERLLEHLDRVDADRTIRVLVLTGRGASFCSGASLAEIETGEMTGARFETLSDALSAARVPTVCALNGSVHGGGAELALCCDFRIGVAGSRISVPAARLGLCYPPGGLRRFVAALGLGAASRLLLAAEELDAEAMLALGFLHRLVPRERLEAETEVLARRLCALAPLAVQAMKRIVREVAMASVDEAEARRLMAACDASEDLREGLAARRERRDPEFRGV